MSVFVVSGLQKCRIINLNNILKYFFFCEEKYEKQFHFDFLRLRNKKTNNKDSLKGIHNLVLRNYYS